MLSAAALLDELMGVDRDRAPNEKKTALHWSDPQVFKNSTYVSIQITFAVYFGFILLTISFIFFDHEGLQTLPLWILPMSAFC